MATISSLGLGSGTLTSDLLDKLKAGETSATVNPITNSITKIQKQKTDLSSLIVTASSAKTAAMDLGDEATYLKRTGTSNSTDIGLTVASGVEPQSMTMTVQQLAQNHVMKTSGFATSTSIVTATNQTMSIALGSNTYNISVTAGTTLEQLAQKINDATSGAISAGVLNTGTGANPYVMTLKTKDTGSANVMKITSNFDLGMTTKQGFTNNAAAGSISLAAGDLKINGVSIAALAATPGANTAQDNALAIVAKINLSTSATGVNAYTNGTGKIFLQSKSGGAIDVVTSNGAGADIGTGADGTLNIAAAALQQAQDAKFTYNGIDMTRSKNEITDIITGATFKLNKVTTSSVALSITQNTADIPTLADTFVSAFNSLKSKVSDLTKYDSATKTSGSLQGISDITSIYGKLSALITKQNDDSESLVDYGFTLDKSGTLSLDKTILNAKLSSDPAALEKMFRGTTDIKKATYYAPLTSTVGATTVAAGDITINGVSIATVTTLAGTAESNAQLFATAINNIYATTGVKAYTDGSGKLTLENPSGGAIKLRTTATAAAASGLTYAVQDTIVGYGSSTKVKGSFAEMNSVLGSLISGDKATLNLLDKSFQSKIDSQTKEKEKATKLIDQRYEIMAKQFALYDSMISKFQQNFSSLQMQINAAANG